MFKPKLSSILAVILALALGGLTIAAPLPRWSAFLVMVTALGLAAAPFVLGWRTDRKLIDRCHRTALRFVMGESTATNHVPSQVLGLEEVLGLLGKRQEQIIESAKAVTRGDLGMKLEPQSESDRLAHVFREMRRALRERLDDMARRHWQQSAHLDLYRLIAADQPLDELSRRVIHFLKPLLGAGRGVLLLSHEKQFRLLEEEGEGGTFFQIEAGSGILGGFLGPRAGPSRTLELIASAGSIQEPWADPVLDRIDFRLPQPARRMLVTPLKHQGWLEGFLILCTCGGFHQQARAFIDFASKRLAHALQASQAIAYMENQLEVALRRTGELQLQQSRLSIINRKQEEQTRSFKESETKLQAQSKQLLAVNQELAQRARDMEESREEIRKKNLELERAKRELEEKAQALEETSKFKSEFLANMSHEFRTPLNSMLILIEILAENKQGNLSKKQLEFIRTLRSSGIDLSNLINEILDLSKIEAGKMVLLVEPTSINELLEYVRLNFLHQAEKKDLALYIALDHGLPSHLNTDSSRLKQIIRNLLSNALKFTHRGSIGFSITRQVPEGDLAGSDLSPDQVVVISVTDTGIGIPKEKYQLIFEAFQQAEGGISRKYGGTGLGLSISREFAHLLGGHIKVHSVEGQGSTFNLYLPENLEPDTEASHASAPRKLIWVGGEVDEPLYSHYADDHDLFTPGERTILIVEHNPHFARKLIDMAHQHKFKILLTADGETGLRMAREYLPCAILLNQQLPEKNGWSPERFRQAPEIRETPVFSIVEGKQEPILLHMGGVCKLINPSLQGEPFDPIFQVIEQNLANPAKRLLLVTADLKLVREVSRVIGEEEVLVSATGLSRRAFHLLKNRHYDGLAVDLDLEDGKGLSWLENMPEKDAALLPPLLICSGRELQMGEQVQLKRLNVPLFLHGRDTWSRFKQDLLVLLSGLRSSSLETDREAHRRKISQLQQAMGGKRILLVDDDVRNVYALTHLLEEQGAVVLHAFNAGETVQMLEIGLSLHLAIIDLALPSGSGLGLVNTFRLQSVYRELPIFVMGNRGLPQEHGDALEAGADEYLLKPIDADVLLPMVGRWLT